MERLLSAGGGGGDGAGNPGAAFGWGILSASSLVLGAAIGILRLPGRVVRAAMMAFGGGALIEALSIELFAHIIETARGGGGHGGEGDGHGEGKVDRGLVFLALGSALAGGLIFAGLDTALSSQGAFLRKASTVHAYVTRLRYALMRRLIARLKLVPMFEVLDTPEVERLAKSMVKERYAAGSTIFQELSRDSSIYFVLSGHVDLTVITQYAGAAPGRENEAGHCEAGAATENVLLGVGDPPAVGSQQTPGTAVEGALDEVKDHFRLGPNDIFGEMALFTGETLQAKAVASTAASVLRIPRAAIHRLLASNRRLQDFVAMTAIDRLRETEVFCRCTPSTVARLVSFMQQAEFEAGDVLFYDVDVHCPIYFVVLGCVEVVRGNHHEGERHTVHANGLLGTEHLVLGHAVHATATAVERTTVLIVQRSDIDKLCEKDERFRQALVASAPGLSIPNNENCETRIIVSLDPPEGAVGPSRFGCAALEELGWQRQTSPANSQQDKEVEENPNNPAMTASEPFTEEELQERRREEEDGGLLGGIDTDLPDLLANQDAAAAAAGKEGHGHDGGRGAQAAIMIWLGILIDGVPESFVMGILVNNASSGTLLAFVVGVFLANFPEAMSSAGTMRLHGMRTKVIMLMWGSIMIMTGIGACVGAIIFPPGSKDDPVVQKVIAVIEGMCGGAMLCMIANTVLPEAFEQGGNVTGLSTLLGFIVAVAVSVAN